MSDAQNNPKLFELAPAEVVVPLQVTHAGHRYRVCHRLRPPAPDDWYTYEAALQPAVEELGDAAEPSFRLVLRASEAALDLWTRLVRRVEGYVLPNTSGHDFSRADSEGHPHEGPTGGLVSSPAGGVGGNADWRELIPLAHKEAAVRALTLVAPARADAAGPNGFFPLAAEEVRVVLEAAANGAAYPRLAHRFRPPTVEAERRYRRLLADNFIVRGGRTPRTLLPPRLPALTRLYDQLILGVEGYTLRGRPLASSLDAVQNMDAWHKRVAVEALFGGLVAETSHSDASAKESAALFTAETSE